jgi:hypothetical protein
MKLPTVELSASTIIVPAARSAQITGSSQSFFLIFKNK